MTLTPAQVKAARALLKWSRDVLAGHVGVSDYTILQFENNGRLPRILDLEAVREAFEVAGVEFTNGDNRGVKLRKVADAPTIAPDDLNASNAE